MGPIITRLSGQRGTARDAQRAGSVPAPPEIQAPILAMPLYVIVEDMSLRVTIGKPETEED